MLTRNLEREEGRNGLRKKSSKRREIMMATVIIVLANAATPIIADTSLSENDIGSEQLVISTVIPVKDNEEFNNKVDVEVQNLNTLEVKYTEEVTTEERNAYIQSIVCDPDNVNNVSGLKESDYALLTQGTWWAGNEQALIDLEKNYGVNAFFAMAVSTLESGYGKSSLATSRNNYYGLSLSRSWDSLYDNTQYWGNLIRKSYINQGRTSADTISTKYCPPNSTEWAKFMHTNMLKYYNALLVRLNNTSK
jgi:beta-N-acetylglucosaminidase